MSKVRKILAVGLALVSIYLLVVCLVVIYTPNSISKYEPIYVTHNYVVEPAPWTPPVRSISKESFATVKVADIQQYNRAAYITITEPSFDELDITIPSDLTAEQITPYIESYCPCFKGLEARLLEIDKEINLIFLFAVSRCETDGGNPEALAGDYNIFNIRNGDGSYCDYASYSESLEHFVQLLTKEYLDTDGMYYEGESIQAIGEHYAVPEWAPFITSVCNDTLWIITN